MPVMYQRTFGIQYLPKDNYMQTKGAAGHITDLLIKVSDMVHPLHALSHMHSQHPCTCADPTFSISYTLTNTAT